ncbi:MAG: phage tail protein [Leptolyngbya sp. SIO1E4]|nr:phage tail protein [Leptolyngbya sp. SIO1E4]
MQLLESSVNNGVSAWKREPGSLSLVSASETRLRLCPGEPSELVVQITNLSAHALHIDLQVSGLFPGRCFTDVEGGELPARGRIEAVLRFELAADFFEARFALDPGQKAVLDYPQVLQVYARTPPVELGGDRAAGTLLAETVFSLHIRPDSRYLNYLPTVYREVDLIGRLLKLFEQAFDPSIQTLELLWAYLDPLTTPETLLPFLAYWVGWPSHIPWSLGQQRRLIRRALEIYRWRGTRWGLRLYLHLYTNLPLDAPETPESEKHISIQETFSQGFVLASARLGETTLLGGGRPFHFIVRLRSPTPQDEPLIRTIIEQEKPAFCTYELYLEERH